MNLESQLAPDRGDRNWLPLAIAAAVVILIVVVGGVILEHRHPVPAVTAINAPLDAYASNLEFSHVAMSESANYAGGKLTYLDAHLTNRGNKTVTGIRLQVLFRNTAHEVVQNATDGVKIIRTRQPYVDLEPISAAPLKPGAEADLRVIFDAVSPEWDGAYPELRIIKVDAK